MHTETKQKMMRPERISSLSSFGKPCLARGSGGAIGDSARNQGGQLLLMERLNRFLAFDEKEGLLTVEAGATVLEILRHFVPRGWTLPIVPQMAGATVGGVVALDSWGMNHFSVGSFGNGVHSLKLMLADGTMRVCSLCQNSELFWATIGGLGLTGVIVELTLQLTPIDSAYMIVKRKSAMHLDELLTLFETDSSPFRFAKLHPMDWEKGTVVHASPAGVEDLGQRVESPLQFREEMQRFRALPLSTVHPWISRKMLSIRSKLKKERLGECVEPMALFLFKENPTCFPIQCVLPQKEVKETLGLLYKEVRTMGYVPFEASLYRFGAKSAGLLSFPKEGWGLDLFFSHFHEREWELAERLGQVVEEMGGRLSPITLMSPSRFRTFYPHLQKWLHVKRAVDPNWVFASNLSRKLKLEELR